ncbi:hypothetical protein ACRALDRAFT_1050228 [Sodiomyces alcalophilus JCM 7366]|uniref:uncharacterized protein n=1 Tax=Sodiomyces alcalophilus JCM 7366 TaxID=591952 RepID=UPI0039B51EED
MSPRWDATGRSGSHTFPRSKAALAVASPYDSLRSTSHTHIEPPLSARTARFPEAEDRISTGTSTPSPQNQNFSRPRKPSLRHPQHPPYLPSPFAPSSDTSPGLPSPLPLPQYSLARQEPNTTAMPFPQVAPTRPTPCSDVDQAGRSKPRHVTGVTTTTTGTAPPVTTSIDGTTSNHGREMAPWMGADESRSSYRSQQTASSAPGTAMTERSSVATRDSSVASICTPSEEPSIEDVMGMYEKGFHDSSCAEDHDDTNRETEMTKRNTRILEALDRSLLGEPVRGTGNLAVPGLLPLVPESNTIFSAAATPSPRASDTDVTDVTDSAIGDTESDRQSEKRDSAKSLHETQRRPAPAPSRSSPPPPMRQASNLTSTTTSSAPSSTVEPEDPDSRDRYGFRKQNQYITREQYDDWNDKYSRYLARRRRKWIAFHKDNGLLTDRPIRFPPPSAAKTKRFVRKGIPPDWRGAAWFYYAGGPAILSKHSGVYEELVRKKATPVDAEAIERDLHRTFPDNIHFKPANSASGPNTEHGETVESEPRMISSLRRVLRAFAIYNPRIGYCQSLNFLAGLLLLFMETEEQSFWLLNVITRVYLPGTHETSLEGSRVDLGVLMSTIRETMPAVWSKIGDDMDGDPNAPRPTPSASSLRIVKSRRRHMPTKSTDRLPPITLCMTAWFMSCFIGTLPIETTLRVWDVFFLEGSKTLFRVALTIFKLGEAEIKAVKDPMEMFGVVQALPRRLLDANAVLEACFKRRNGFNHLDQDTIETRRRERRDKVHAELDREARGGQTESSSASRHQGEGESSVRRKGTLFRLKAK